MIILKNILLVKIVFTIIKTFPVLLTRARALFPRKSNLFVERHHILQKYYSVILYYILVKLNDDEFSGENKK